MNTTIAQRPLNSALCDAKFSCLRWLLKNIGPISDGIKVGWKYGFDSGQSLDYVYQNKARGLGPIGKLVDRCYLNSAGWSGIRSRGILLKEAILWGVRQSEVDSKAAIELVDVASGPGRYVLDLLSSGGIKPERINARMYDVDERGLEQGRQRAQKLGLQNVQFVHRDAFVSSAHYALGKADVAVVSGILELFSNNDIVSQSLGATRDLLRDDGYLIYTNQPWHPDLEFISKVLTNRDGEAWEMRCRPQQEIDELVQSAGFSKLTTRYTKGGIFSVSVAVKTQS